MELIRIGPEDADRIAPLLAAFRVQLKAYKGIRALPDAEAGKAELLEFLEAGFPVYAARDGDVYAGYMVCRIDAPCLWVEHLFVREDFRRRGAAALLFRKARAMAASMGEDTVYSFVHPNNAGMIAFLRAMGCTVLNMLEIRGPYAGEKLTTTVHVDGEVFDY